MPEPTETIHTNTTLAALKSGLCWVGRLFRHAYQVIQDYLFIILLGASLVFFLVGALFPHDPAILQSVQSGAGETTLTISRLLSDSGKFEFIPLLLPIAIALFGKFRRRPELYRAAAVILLAGLVAGIAVNVLRPAYGRARPSSGEPNGFYGPSAEHRFNSFPSGHSTTAWATAISTSLTVPPLAPPIIAWAAGVSISRMYQNSHYLGDVTAGAALGSFFGWVLVAGMRRMRL
jgi:membrane-associated phospholipid phosphatase